jgi:hypothetical protein
MAIDSRSLWVDRYLVTGERPPIDAVQTLRNSLLTTRYGRKSNCEDNSDLILPSP